MQLGWNQAVFMGVRSATEFERLSHNMANANTVGFKQELSRLWQLQAPSDPTDELGQRPSYYLDVISRDFTQGNLRSTGNETDLALDGPGFFKVQTPQGMRYTRDGTFQLNNSRQLVTKDGYLVQGKNGPLIFDSIDQNFYLDLEGGVHMDGSLGDQILVADFANPQALAVKGKNYFAATPESGGETTPPETTKVRQGEIEDSNFDPNAEMVQLVNIQRSFEAYMKVLDTFAAKDRKVIDEIGTPA